VLYKVSEYIKLMHNYCRDNDHDRYDDPKEKLKK